MSHPTGKWVVVHDDDETVCWSLEEAQQVTKYWRLAGAEVLTYEETAEGEGVWMQAVML